MPYRGYRTQAALEERIFWNSDIRFISVFVYIVRITLHSV
jgi:hypothetical protein